MNIVDIIALAKAGYKPADVKELVALATPEPEPKKPEETETEQTDYKALYEQIKAELDKTKADLTEAQKNINGQNTEVEKIDEIEELKKLFR